MIAARLTTVLLVAVALATPASAAAPVTHDDVQPPGLIGCDPQPTSSDSYPAGRLRATGLYRAINARVRFRIDQPTQATKVTVRAYLPGGRRADLASPREYECTVPGLDNQLAFDVDRRTTGRRIARGPVRFKVVVRMVNANGRRTTLRRAITVRAQ